MPKPFASTLEQLQSSIHRRWGIIDWDRHYPWWRRPGNVRILMYADGSVRFNGGPFLGLQYVKSLLESRAYPYVNFDVSTAHRDGGDPSASIAGAKRLTDLDVINKYDEIWFFGISSTPNLTTAELTLLDQFIAAPKFGGVLVTGDHADLGKGIAGQITRAGQMRRYPAPPASPPSWNTTLVEGPDANVSFDFDEQSDDRPQAIRYRRYAMSSHFALQRRYRPHPVLCGPEGPVTVFPDHQHEGEALAPTPTPGSAHWPTKNGHQEAPEVIAWGKVNDPSASKHGQEIGLVSTYNGHNVDVGRIIADSTWHHWFDINITGAFPLPSPYAGFDATPGGQDALKKIDAYFLNCGVWLAPPAKQADMRNFAWWSILWTDRIVEISPDLPIRFLGEHAIDALGQRASRCNVSEWILDLPIFKEKIPRWEWPMLFERLQLVDIPFEHYVAGGILRELITTVGPANTKLSFPESAPEDPVLSHAIERGVDVGLATLVTQLKAETNLAFKLAENSFRLPSSEDYRTSSKGA